MTEVEAAWVAGVMEGEACFSILDKCGRFYAVAAVKMTDEDIVRRLHKVTGLGHVTGPHQPRNPAWSRTWSWTVSSGEQFTLLTDAILPFMGERRSARIREIAAKTTRQTVT